ncbi:MAG: hypothetical protein JWM27_4755 [Gemmatimonadetes bacterium]|nr:hypothetical protein [Gemmatimonadota bacterium]
MSMMGSGEGPGAYPATSTAEERAAWQDRVWREEKARAVVRALGVGFTRAEALPLVAALVKVPSDVLDQAVRILDRACEMYADEGARHVDVPLEALTSLAYLPPKSARTRGVNAGRPLATILHDLTPQSARKRGINVGIAADKQARPKKTAGRAASRS